MQNFYCNAFDLGKYSNFKVVNGVLTVKTKEEPIKKVIKAPCGGFLLDGDFFEVKGEKVKRAGVESENEVVGYCRDIVFNMPQVYTSDGEIVLEQDPS